MRWLNLCLLIVFVTAGAQPLKGKSVLVIGGTYFLGKATVLELLDNGATVTMFNRGNQPKVVDALKQLHVTYIPGDRNNALALNRLFRLNTFDVVVDMVMYTPDELTKTVRALRSRDKTRPWRISKYIYISSLSEYESCQDRSRRLFGTARGPRSLLQESQFRVSQCTSSPRPYAANKFQVHKQLLALHAAEKFPFVALFLPSMVGAGALDAGRSDPRHLAYHLVALTPPDAFSSPLLLRETWRLRVTAHSNHVSQAVVAVVSKGAEVLGQHFHIAMKEAVTVQEYLQHVRTSAGALGRMEYQLVANRSGWMGPLFSREMHKQWGIVDTSKAERVLGWKPLPIQVWMKPTTQWWGRDVNMARNYLALRSQLPISVVKYWDGQLKDLIQKLPKKKSPEKPKSMATAPNPESRSVQKPRRNEQRSPRKLGEKQPQEKQRTPGEKRKAQLRTKENNNKKQQEIKKELQQEDANKPVSNKPVSNKPVSVMFRNDLRVKANVFWKDPSGIEFKKATLQPGKATTVASHPRHVFVMRAKVSKKASLEKVFTVGDARAQTFALKMEK